MGILSLPVVRMVTTQELLQREEELKESEKQVQQVARQKVPQRKFGAGVTRQQQQQIVQRKQQASQVLSQIQQEKKQISLQRITITLCSQTF